MKNKIFLVLKKELREVFRDKKSLSMMIISPLMIPLVIIGLSYMLQSETEKGENEYNKIGFAYELTEQEQEIADALTIETYTGSKKEMKQLLKDSKIYAYIEKKNDTYVISYDQNAKEGTAALLYADSYLNQYKAYLQDEYITSIKQDSNKIINIINIEHHNIGKEKSNFMITYLTSYAFMFILMSITTASTYPATDTTAGEKERGTLETLLTFPIKNRDIIIGKYLSVTISSILTGILGYVLTLISLKYVCTSLEMFKKINLMPSFTNIIITLLIIICYSLLISGICIAVASMSKTFKEAQSALSPITIISLLPGMIAFMLEIKTTNLIAAIPFINFMQIYNDITKGTINYLHITLMFISTITLIVIVFTYIVKQYHSEKILFNINGKEKAK